MAQVFPRWSNHTPRFMALGTLLATSASLFALYWWGSPTHTDVGYAPRQPIPYSHKLHAGELGMDCRYCHAYVERGPFAGVPPNQVCMNCHRQVKTESFKLDTLRTSWAEGENGGAIPWKRIHKLPDFVYFDHSAHVGVGVGANRAAIGCETCHGRIDTMEVVRQEKSLSMGWCIECHSSPAPFLRPEEQLTKMRWVPEPEWTERAQRIAATLNPPGSLSSARRTDAAGTSSTHATAGCNGCHR